MQISITDRFECLNAELDKLVERRLLFALARFDSRIDWVDCTIQEIVGPQGQPTKQCCLTVQLVGGPEVEIVERDPDLRRCLASASRRIGRSVGRAIVRLLDAKYSRRAMATGP